jgi:Putative Ig domain
VPTLPVTLSPTLSEIRSRKRRRRRSLYRPIAERLEERCLLSVSLLSEFNGLSFNDSGGYVPPDSCGAAGTTKYVETVNQTLRVTNLNGSAPATDSFSHFWYTTGGLTKTSSSSFLSDPIVMWDDQIQRFIVGDQDVDGNNFISNFQLAVSKTASPASLTTADWYFGQVNTTENNGSTAIYDADYPGNFGFNHDAFVFTLNMFAQAGTSHVLVESLKVSDLVNGTFTSFHNDAPNGLFSLRPTTMHDSVANDPMWLLTEGSNRAAIRLVKMTNVLSNSASFTTTTLNVNAYSGINPPLQPSGVQITTNIDTRIMKAAEWGGKLVATHHIGVGSSEDDARWYEFNVSGATPTLLDQGDVVSATTKSGTPNVYDFYPGIDINSLGEIGMSFMQSSQTGTNQGQFMSVYVTGRGPGDPAGTMETPVLAQAGQNNYTDFSSPHRAGDLSGINVAPDGTFWACNEYATAASNDNWGQAIPNFTIGPQINNATLANWTVNQPGYSQTLTSTGGTGAVTFSETGTLPPGLTFTSTGVISGMPTSVGSFTFTVTATDSTGAKGSRSYTVTINPAITFTSTNNTTWTAGLAFSQVIIAAGGTGSKTFTTTASSLPPGITLSTTGTLAGTPTTVGTYTFTITATDSVGASGSQNYTFVVNPSVTISTTSLPNWTVNAPNYNATIHASGGTGSLTFGTGGAAVPAGLTLASTGVLSGTPTAAGTFSFTITATDSLGYSTGKVYTVTIAPAVSLAPGTLPPDTVNIAYDRTITASGGTGTLTLATSNVTGLIPGLNVPDSGTGSIQITGTPTASGTETFTVTATDSVGGKATQTYSVTVNPAVSITTTSLTNWTAGLSGYSQTISATGGTGSLIISAPSASLPPGLTLSSAGVLAGTPSTAGTFTFTVTATDSIGASAGESYSVVINPAVVITTTTLPAWTNTLAGYNQTVVASGGTGSLTFSAAGTLPTGLTFSTTGVLSGTPTAAGSFTFTVTATDTLGASGSQIFTVTINPVITLNPGVLPPGLTNVAYNKTISASGGTGTVTLAVSNLSGAIPGLNVPSGGTGSLAITGTPTATGTETFTVTATDSLGSSTIVNYSITVNKATVFLSLPSSGYAAAPGGMVLSVPVMINQLQDQASTNHVGLQSATLALTYPLGVFGFTLGSGNATGNVSLGSVPLSDTVSPGGAGDWNLTATAPQDGQLNISLTAKTGKAITSNNPPNGGSLVLINFPVSSGYAPTSPTDQAITIVTANGAFHTSILGSNGSYILQPTPPYPGSVTIYPPVSITTTSLSAWTAGQGGYNQTVAAGGGFGALTFSAMGSIPTGLTLSTTGVLTGTPTSAGDYTFTVKATDTSGASGSQTFTVTINPTITFTTTSLADDTAGTPSSQTIGTSGGTGTLTFSAAGTLPGGVILSTDGVLNGTPTVSGSYAFTVTATDATGASASQAFTLVVDAGPFSEYLVTVAGSNSVQAGRSFLLAVQAADAFDNPVTNYSGPATITASINPTTAASNFPATVAISSSGLGLFLGNVEQVGSYTATASNGSFTGSTASPVTVTPGPAATLAFAAQPQNTPTGVTLQAVTVQVQDFYGNLVTSDNADVVTLAVPRGGPGPFSAGSNTTAAIHNGVATFNNLSLAVPGSYALSAVVPGKYTGPKSGTFTIAPLQVLSGSFQGTPIGFSLQFNAPYLVNSVTPVLYGHGFGATGIVPSVILTTDPGNLSDTAAYVNGSLILDPSTNGITFVSTTTANIANSKIGGGTGSPLLPDGVYTAIIRSSAATDGFQALASGGGYLDGLGSGMPGSGDFTATFTVNAAAAHDDIVWIPPTADGPGLPLNAPGKNQVGGGYPIYLSDSTGTVTDVQVTLNYNPALLTVTGVSGSGFSLLASSTPGQAVLQYSGPALPTGVQTVIGFVQATVPSGTAANPIPYKQKDLLTLTNVVLNGGATPVVTGNALHLEAYVGDADGNGMYSNNDAVLITRVLLSSDSGFSAYPLVDPLIVADTDGNGFIPADAALQVNEAGTGLATATLPTPPIPPDVFFVLSNSSNDTPASLQVASPSSTAAAASQQAPPTASTGVSLNVAASTLPERLRTLYGTITRRIGRCPGASPAVAALDEIFAQSAADTSLSPYARN